MAESVTAAVARVQAPAAVITAYLEDFARALPATVPAERFEAWALNMIQRALSDPKQHEAWTRVLDPGNPAGLASVVSALKDCASLGLQPGREYHLVPFGAVVTGITDYKGEIKLITNARRCSVVAQLVHKADDFYMTGANIPPKHDADWFAPDEVRGPVIGGYAFCAYPDGESSLVTRMSELGFAKHRSVAKTKAVWDEWPDEMRLKTLIHGQRKFVPWSAERMWT